MKYLGFILILFIQTANAIEPDKEKHLQYSTAIGFAAQQLSENRFISYSTCLSVGLGKEVYDQTKPKGEFSNEDLLFDALGCILGIESNALFHININFERNKALTLGVSFDVF